MNSWLLQQRRHGRNFHGFQEAPQDVQRKIMAFPRCNEFDKVNEDDEQLLVL